MTVSLTKPTLCRVLTLGLSVCFLLGMNGVGMGQDLNAPRLLAPRSLDPNTQKSTDGTIAPVPMRTISGGINVQTLDKVSKEASGVLSGKDAFASDMWTGVNRIVVEALIKSLPNRPSAEHLRIIQRRLLLSAAQPPEGQAGNESLLSIRARKLAQMGQTSDVLSLLGTAKQAELNADLAILETESLLIEGDLKQACQLSAGHIQASKDIFWIKTMALCQLLAKQEDQAMLSLSLLRESDHTDEAYYTLMDALSAGETAKLNSLPNPTALDLALIQIAKPKLSDDILETDNPNLIAVLAKFAQVPTDQRLSLVQKAVDLGLLKIEDLRLSYMAIKFNNDDLSDPIAKSEKLPAASSQALLYQVSTKQGQLAAISSETIALALEKTTDYTSTAKLYQPIITSIAQTIDLLWFAPTAVRSQLAAGDWENAKAWAFMLRNAAFSDAQAASAWSKLRPLAVLAGFDIDPNAVQQALLQWWNVQEPTPEHFQEAALLFSMVDGLGLTVPDSLWFTLMNAPELSQGLSPKTGIWIKLNKASMAGRVGETLLMVLHGLGPQELNTADATFLRDSLFSLRMIDLEQNARILAIEAALNAGI